MEEREIPPNALTINGEPITLNGDFITVNPQFVGREKELQHLESLIRSRRQAVSITGDAGIGKTYLVREFISKQKLTTTEWLSSNNVLETNKNIDNFLLKIRLSDKRINNDYLVVIDDVDKFHNDEIQHFIEKLLNYKAIRTVIIIGQRSVNIPHLYKMRLEALSENELRQLELFQLLDKKEETKLPSLFLKSIVTTGEKTSEGKLIEIVNVPWFEILKCIQKDSSVIYQIPSDKWEEIIAGAYKKAGFDDVILTPRSGDFGRDVIAVKKGLGTIRIIDQVKAYKPEHLVDANDVRALMGVLHTDGASKGFVTTTSDFAPKIKTDPLITPLMPSRLELINGNALIQRLLELNK